MFGEEFARDQPAVVGKPLRHPDGAEPGQRADFQHPPGAGQLDQELEQLAGVGRHFDGRHPGVDGGAHRLLERIVGMHHGCCEEVFHCHPPWLGPVLKHGHSLARRHAPVQDRGPGTVGAASRGAGFWPGLRITFLN
jgi:hypothetical protein